MDAQTGAPLAFANIVISKHVGTVSNFDGQFEISIPKDCKYFSVSYIGYHSKRVNINPQTNFYKIYLQASSEQLRSVVINGKYINPAIKLMKKAIKLKPQNNYQYKLHKYAFTKYLKFVVAGEADKIPGKLDTVYKNGQFFKIDSTLIKFKKETTGKYLWLLESIAKVNGQKGGEKTKVIATRTAGLKKPLYELIALQMSGQNIYNDRYNFLFNSYIGPLAKASFKTYKYEIEDTIHLQNRPVIVVNYRNTQKPLISGRIYLDKQSLAIAKFSLNTYKAYQFRVIYDFKYYPIQNIWFPADITMTIKKADQKNMLNIGNQIQIMEQQTDSILVDKHGDSLHYTRQKNTLDYTYAHTSIHFFDVLIGKNYPDKISFNLQVSPLATQRSRQFWENLRHKPYTPKELRTYRFIDSIGEKEKIDYHIHKYKSLAYGYFPLTDHLDLDLIDLIDYNRYEGIRLKMNVQTNEQFSDKWQIAAYTAYGFKDKQLKYSGSLSFKLRHLTQTYIKVSYTDDLEKSAAFRSYKGRYILSKMHHYADDKFYHHRTAGLSVTHLLNPNFKLNTGLSKTYINTKYPIPFHRGRIEFPQKDLFFYTLDFEITPFSQYYLAPEGRKLLKDGYPKFYINFEKNIPQWQMNHVDYYRIDFQSYIKKKYVNLDYTELYLRLGLASQGAGIDKLFMPVTNDYEAANPLQRFNLSKAFAFETMKDLEFVDNFVTSIHLQHTFTQLKLWAKKNIDVRLLGAAAFGLSYDDNKYTGIKSLDKIYYETGVEFRQLWANLGLGFYYRLGAYAYPHFGDNLSVRLTVNPFSIIKRMK